MHRLICTFVVHIWHMTDFLMTCLTIRSYLRSQIAVLWLQNFRPKKINVLFPKTSQYFLGSVGRQIFFFAYNFLYRKSFKIIKNTLKIEEKFSDVPKIFGAGHKKVGSVGFQETRHFFYFCLSIIPVKNCFQVRDPSQNGPRVAAPIPRYH